jgi:hypothetical protein
MPKFLSASLTGLLLMPCGARRKAGVRRCMSSCTSRWGELGLGLEGMCRVEGYE